MEQNQMNNDEIEIDLREIFSVLPVSYTHLTLPTT